MTTTNWKPKDSFFIDTEKTPSQAKKNIAEFVQKHALIFNNKVISSNDFSKNDLSELSVNIAGLQGFSEFQLPFIMPNYTIPVVCEIQPFSACPKHSHDDLIGFWFIASGKVIVNKTTVLKAKDWFITDIGASYELHTEAEGCVMFHGYAPHGISSDK